MMRKILAIDEELCNGCGQCVPACAEGAIQVVDGKARLISEKYCDGLGACLNICPQGAIQVLEREAEEFDPEAVDYHRRDKEMSKKGTEHAAPSECPSRGEFRVFAGLSLEKSANTTKTGVPSALSHWPVQIRLVPSTASFLKGAHLLVSADCVPIAYASFHKDFLKDRVVLIGCPKFDNRQLYVQKFTEIFKNADIKSVTVVVMEVPCCQGLPTIIKKALRLAGKNIPIEEITISPNGKIVKKEKVTT
jgi:NAD-dependent dihydropyrimidine dehydrogenase PreA subunit